MAKSGHDRLIAVGVIKGAHGVRGDVRLKSFTAEPDAIFTYGPLLDEVGKLLLTPVTHRSAKDHFIVKATPLLQKEAWDAIRGTLVYVPRSALPEEDEDEFYIEDLVGLPVYTGGDTPAGRVKALQNFGADDLIEVQMTGGGHTVLVPFTLKDVPTVDVKAGRIVIPALDEWAENPSRDESNGA